MYKHVYKINEIVRTSEIKSNFLHLILISLRIGHDVFCFTEKQAIQWYKF